MIKTKKPAKVNGFRRWLRRMCLAPCMGDGAFYNNLPAGDVIKFNRKEVVGGELL